MFIFTLFPAGKVMLKSRAAGYAVLSRRGRIIDHRKAFKTNLR
jgi:hypothetical protein